MPLSCRAARRADRAARRRLLKERSRRWGTQRGQCGATRVTAMLVACGEGRRKTSLYLMRTVVR